MNLDDLVGQTFDFYGIDGTALKLGDLCLEAVEDPQDGYRSCLQEMRPAPEGSIFFSSPVARVTVLKDSEIDGWSLVDEAGHKWLTVGTGNAEDWYPYFVFSYSPVGQ